MANLPSSNSTAVTAAPTHTSCHCSGTEGMNLKIIANSTVVAPTAMRVFRACSVTSQAGHRPLAQPPRAATPALMTRDTMSRKASPRISPNDSTRARSTAHRPEGLARCGTCQMRSSALCNSANTVVAPTSSTTPLIRPATRPRVGSLAARTSACTATAASWPMSPCNCPTISPCTASRPNSAPATAITITSRGAMENTV